MANDLTVKTAIEIGDAEGLESLLAEDASRANALVRWGKNDSNLTHPLHYVSDMLFEGKLQRGKELPLIEALIKAGADVDFQSAAKTDTPLIGAASLGAEDVGLALLRAGARPELTGIFGEKALHWAAHLGEIRLAPRLIEAGNLNARDGKFDGTPLDWAIHGRMDARGNPPPGNLGRQCEVAAMLVEAGAEVEPRMLASEAVQADPAMLAALTRG